VAAVGIANDTLDDNGAGKLSAEAGTLVVVMPMFTTGCSAVSCDSTSVICK
jgi:hypothetical protein